MARDGLSQRHADVAGNLLLGEEVAAGDLQLILVTHVALLSKLVTVQKSRNCHSLWLYSRWMNGRMEEWESKDSRMCVT